MFEFDKYDKKVRDEFYLKGYYFLLTSVVLNVYSLFALWKVNTYKDYGLLQRFCVSNGFMIPFYAFAYFQLNSKYMDLKKHLTLKYVMIN